MPFISSDLKLLLLFSSLKRVPLFIFIVKKNLFFYFSFYLCVCIYYCFFLSIFELTSLLFYFFYFLCIFHHCGNNFLICFCSTLVFIFTLVPPIALFLIPLLTSFCSIVNLSPNGHIITLADEELLIFSSSNPLMCVYIFFVI